MRRGVPKFVQSAGRGAASSAARHSSSSSSSLDQRCRLLDAARGLGSGDRETRRRKRPLPCFPLQTKHVGEQLLSAPPSSFHEALCGMIGNAKERVSLASLYIGPAASPHQQKEAELLDALAGVAPGVGVKIVMDANRGLRPVPLSRPNSDHHNDDDDKGATTSAAEAVAKAIAGGGGQKGNGVYLCQVLGSPLDTILPNPLNEVAGVFHIKAYVVDDNLILSGANLSEEYFVDRHDRYLRISNGGNGLVDFYDNLIHILCEDYSQPYVLSEDDGSSEQPPQRRRSPQPFKDRLTELFSDEDPQTAKDLLLGDPDTVALCIPTFHHPQEPLIMSSKNESSAISDVQVTLDLLREGARGPPGKEPTDNKDENDGSISDGVATSPLLRLSSAYLNPSSDLLEAMKAYPSVELLTAGRESHGFRPKKKAGNKGKDWIPSVFDHLQCEALRDLRTSTAATPSTKATLLHWERPDWTFHAKGLWIERSVREGNYCESEPSTKRTTVPLAAMLGSSNYGRRSFERDMESNLVLVFPEPGKNPNPLMDDLEAEWETLRADSLPVDPDAVLSNAATLPFYIRGLYPFIKSFF